MRRWELFRTHKRWLIVIIALIAGLAAAWFALTLPRGLSHTYSFGSSKPATLEELSKLSLPLKLADSAYTTKSADGVSVTLKQQYQPGSSFISVENKDRAKLSISLPGSQNPTPVAQDGGAALAAIKDGVSLVYQSYDNFLAGDHVQQKESSM